jgi:hypothetical protein
VRFEGVRILSDPRVSPSPQAIDKAKADAEAQRRAETEAAAAAAAAAARRQELESSVETAAQTQAYVQKLQARIADQEHRWVGGGKWVVLK